MRALPDWLESKDVTARWMALDGSDMQHLGFAIPPQLNRAVAKRVGEYRAGRTCARGAIGALAPDLDLTGTDWPLLGLDRAPIWPAGITGSLTHSAFFVICIAGPSHLFSGLGIDIERPIPPQDIDGIAPGIAQTDELACLDTTPWSDLALTLLFSAK